MIISAENTQTTALVHAKEKTVYDCIDYLRPLTVKDTLIDRKVSEDGQRVIVNASLAFEIYFQWDSSQVIVISTP